jgi:hypothetical protein
MLLPSFPWMKFFHEKTGLPFGIQADDVWFLFADKRDA